MTCTHIRELLPLYAGGDLQPGKITDVTAHLAVCAVCRKEYEELVAAREAMREIAALDTPPLDDAFTDSVLARTVMMHDSLPWHHNPRMWMRLAVAACMAGMIAVLWWNIDHDIARFREHRLALQRTQVEALVTRDPSLVTADRLAGLSIRGPYRLDEWKPSGEAGLFAVMHKPDPEHRPEVFSIDYLGEARRIEYHGDPWRRQRINRLTERAGSPNNIYIAEYPMPDKSPYERKYVLQTMISSLQPYFN